MNRIKVLPELVINQIAAGEVIERPASILKELLENSIDANSSMIRIYLDNGGINGIKVVDNGIGIHPDDIPLVFKQHATSKIENLKDLDFISSLGFRGEALASIASISMVNIITSQLEPSGTTIEVKDIFYNVPVRKKFLRSSNTEFNYIQEIFKRIALSNFSVGFMLYNSYKNSYNNLNNNYKLIKSLPAIYDIDVDQDLMLKEKRISKLVGNKFIEHAFFFNTKVNDFQLYGWIGNVYDISGSCIQYFYLNNRPVKDKLLNAAIKQAIQKLNVPTAYCLYFRLNPMFVDINVHPTKQEVRFSDPKVIYAFIYESVLEAFDQFKFQRSRIEHVEEDRPELVGTSIDKDRVEQVGLINQSDLRQIAGDGSLDIKSFECPSLSGGKYKYSSQHSLSDKKHSPQHMSSHIENIDRYNNINLKIFPIFNNQYVLFSNVFLSSKEFSGSYDFSGSEHISDSENASSSDELLFLNVKQGLQWLLINSLQQKIRLVSYELIIPERVKLGFEIAIDFQIVKGLLVEFKFDVEQIHTDVLLIKSIPEYFYLFEIQINYARFFKELMKMISKRQYLQNLQINREIISLLIDCIKLNDFNDFKLYSQKDLIKLIMILINAKFMFGKLNQSTFEKLV